MQFMNMKKLLCTLAIPMTLCQVAQGQTISSRLLAQAHSSNDGATFHKQDSTVYNYLSNNRGGDLNTQLKFDMATKWLFIDDTTTVNNQNFIQEFDSQQQPHQQHYSVLDRQRMGECRQVALFLRFYEKAVLHDLSDMGRLQLDQRF
jgi:hypothetical protein